MENKNWIAWVNMELPLNTPGGVLHVNGAILVDDKAKYSLEEATSQPINSEELLLEVIPNTKDGDIECLLNYKKDLREVGQYKSVRIIGFGKDDVIIEDIEVITKDLSDIAEMKDSKNQAPRIRPKTISYYFGEEFLHANNFFYNSANLLERVEGKFEESTLQYDSLNKLVAFNSREMTSAFQYDSKGRFSLIEVTITDNLKKEVFRSPIMKVLSQKMPTDRKIAKQTWRLDYSTIGRLSKIFIYDIEDGKEVLVEKMEFNYTIKGKLKQVKTSEETINLTLDDYYNPHYNTHALYVLQDFMPIYNNTLIVKDSLFTETSKYKYNNYGFPTEENLAIVGNNGEIPEPYYTKRVFEYENY